MKYCLLFLTLFVQINASVYTDYNPLKNCAQKTLPPESSDGDGRSYILFRYYDPSSGNYLNQDPIGLDGGMHLYSYVHNPNSWVDMFGLDGHHATPRFMGGAKKQNLVKMDHADHVQLHRDMNTFLETKTRVIGGETVSMRPKKGNSGATIQENFSKEQRLAALAEFYTINDKKIQIGIRPIFRG